MFNKCFKTYIAACVFVNKSWRENNEIKKVVKCKITVSDVA